MVLLHYVTAFAPAIGSVAPTIPHAAWQGWFIETPLFFPFDGYFAVAVFFLISGTALTFSFETSGASFLAQTGRRLVRLGLPMAASVMLAGLWFFLWPLAHVQAGNILHNAAWLGAVGPPHITWASLVKEVCFGGMLLGHAGETLLPPPIASWAGLSPFFNSYNAPLWTLHLEFYGSLLVLLLVKLRRRLSRNWHRGILVTLLILLITHPLDLFVIGYGTARLMRTGFWQRLTQPWWIMALAVIAIAAGIGMSAHLAPAHAKEGFERFGNITCLPMRLDAFHAFGHYAAILIFAGVMILPFAQRLLSSRFCQFLGRYSFSLYLVHFPVLFTVTCAVVVRAQGLQHGRAALSIAAGLLLTICLAWLFERYVDAPATRLSRRIAGQRPLLASLPARA